LRAGRAAATFKIRCARKEGNMFRFGNRARVCKLVPAGALALSSWLLMTPPQAALAQSNQSAWQPTHPSNDPTADKSVNDSNTFGQLGKGFSKPASCTGQKYAGQQAVALCVATPDGFFWRWFDFNIYECLPDGQPSFRTIEYTRTTNAHCKKENWETTKKFASSYGEDWTSSTSETVTESADATGDPPPLPGGGRPDGRTATASKITKDGKVVEEDTTKADEKKEAKTETKTETKPGTNKATDGGTSRGTTEKRPRKSVRNGERATPRHAVTKASANKDTATRHQEVNAPAIPVMIGIGFGLGTRHGGGADHDLGRSPDKP